MTAPKRDAPPPDLLVALRQEIARHPYRTLAIAAGVGYLLGTRLGGPLIALLSSRAGIKVGSTLVAPLLGSISSRG
jgi:hypothetical protein